LCISGIAAKERGEGRGGEGKRGNGKGWRGRRRRGQGGSTCNNAPTLSKKRETRGMKRRVLVVGCGVIGLTTGLTLLREGHEVTLITKNTPPDTTSNAAGAFWYPVLDEPCSSLRNQLALATFDYVHNHILHKHDEAACVERMIDTYYNLELAAPHEEAVCHSPCNFSR
jgi:hypothetical protein